MAAILGISLGTRSLGMAVFIDDELISTTVRKFSGKWSKRKMAAIAKVIQNKIERHAITSIAIKSPDMARSSHSLNELFEQIKKYAIEKQLPVKTRSLSELKHFLLGRTKGNKQNIIEYVVNKYPELIREFAKEKRNRNTYYLKMFEAVAVAICLEKQK